MHGQRILEFLRITVYRSQLRKKRLRPLFQILQKKKETGIGDTTVYASAAFVDAKHIKVFKTMLSKKTTVFS